MFDTKQPPAGETRGGKACIVKVPIQKKGRYRCRRCGTYRDLPARHVAIMAIECPGGADEFQDLS